MQNPKHPASQPILTLESMYLMSASTLDIELDSDPNVEIDPAIGPLPGLDFPGEWILDSTEDGRPQFLFLDEQSPGGSPVVLVETEFDINASNLHDLDGIRVFAQRVDADGNVVGEAKLVVQNDGKIGVAGTAEAGVSNQIGLNPHDMIAEQIVIAFEAKIKGGEFTFTNLFKGEGDKRNASGHEQGKWEAFQDGRVVASGTFVADSNHAGRVNIELPDGVMADRIAFTPTEYSGGQNGSTLDSSDFFLKSVRVTVVETLVDYNDSFALAAVSEQVTFVEDAGPVVLGASVDTGFSVGSLDGASISIERNGGPNTDDVFLISDQLSDVVEDSDLAIDGISIGQVTENGGGRLVMTFNENADSDLVNALLARVAYSNSADYISGDADLSWTLTKANGTATTAATTVRLIDSDRIYVTTAEREVDGDTSSIAALIANSGGTGISLEEAIIAANNTENFDGADEIFFNIAGDGVHVIEGAGQPEITDAVTIDAASESDFVDRPLIVMDGNDAEGNGFTITSTADGTEIRGFNIRDFAGHGIAIEAGSEDNTIANNWIGRLANDGSDAGVEEQNGGAGIYIAGAHNYIGGMASSEANVISGNYKQGIRISGEDADVNVIHGNLIGTDLDGQLDIGNRWAGIRVDNGADDTVIGGTQSGAGNILSGNGTYGVRITGVGTLDATIQGNLIGTDHTGENAMGNDINGILVDRGATGTTIGGSDAGAGNVISANARQGVRVSGEGTDQTVIQGNVIGTNADGVAELGNGAAGILIDGGAQDTVVGGDHEGAANIVSGNGTHGVRVTGEGTDDSTIQGNLIGTDESGANALGNAGNGVRIDNGAAGTTVGGESERAGNVISGNGTQGVRVSGEQTVFSVIQGNVIGTDSDGLFALGNRFAGVLIDSGARHSVVGGSAFGSENIISGNGTHGVRITGAGTNDHTVQGNLIGTDHMATVAIGNAGHGVLIDGGSQQNTVGGDADEVGNIIAGSGLDGVRITGDGTDSNVVLGNYIVTTCGPDAHLANSRADIHVGAETQENVTETSDADDTDSETTPIVEPPEPNDLLTRVVTAVGQSLPEGVVLVDATPGTGEAGSEDSVIITLALSNNPDAGEVTVLIENAHAVASGEVVPDFSDLPFNDVIRDVPATGGDSAAPKPEAPGRKSEEAPEGKTIRD